MTPPLRLMLWHWGRHGGGPRYTYELARALKELPGVETHLSISRQSEIVDEFAALGLPTLWVDTYSDLGSCLRRSTMLPQLALRMRRYVCEHRLDIVDSTMTHLWTRLVTPALTKGTGARVLCTVHDATPHPGEASLLKNWFYAPVPGANHYIALTEFVADQLTKLHGIGRERISVIPHGVLTFANPPPPVARAAGAPLRLLFLGRILPYKGLDRLLEAYGMLRADGHELTLTIAGSGDLGAMSGRIAELPGVTLHHRWIAEEEIPRFLAQADCVVLPYVEASQSGVVPAAFAAGVTAVVTPVGGLAEQVLHQQNGLVTEDCSPASLAHAITRLQRDPALLSRLRAGACHTATTELSWNRIAEKLMCVARECRMSAAI